MILNLCWGVHFREKDVCMYELASIGLDQSERNSSSCGGWGNNRFRLMKHTKKRWLFEMILLVYCWPHTHTSTDFGWISVVMFSTLQDTEFKAVPLSTGEAEEYMVALKQEMKGAMRRLPSFIKPLSGRAGEWVHCQPRHPIIRLPQYLEVR